jgi:SAM-dependent methyltransferase
LDKQFITKHWYASSYEQFENQTNDVEFFLKVLREQTDGTPQNILEAACGGGRISVPLAQAGHKVTGFDSDGFMLLRCYRRMKDIPNITCYQADAINADWGTGYDVVVMAGNILINIETELDYVEAQQVFICKSTTGYKHIPTLKQVYGWLAGAGFDVEKTYRNYTDEPLSENEPDFVRATIWAKKG